MFFLTIFTLFAVIFQTCSGACHVCGSRSNVACVSETEFQICHRNVRDESVILKCPENSYCTNTKEVCTKFIKPACIYSCGKCHPQNKYACVSENEYKLCYESNIPVSATMKCPQGQVCSFKTGNKCVKPTKTIMAQCQPGQKPAETTGEKPAESTPEKPAETTPEKPAETTPDKPAETTPDKPAETTPDKPAETTPDKPAENN